MTQAGLNIKEIRVKKGLLQKEVAAADLHPANHNKMEKGERSPSVEALRKISMLFDMTVDQVINYERDIPQVVTICTGKNEADRATGRRRSAGYFPDYWQFADQIQVQRFL